MKKSAPESRAARSMLRWLVTIAWILLGGALSFMCIRAFGDNIADVGVPALAIAAGLIWYFTERRDRNKPEEHK